MRVTLNTDYSLRVLMYVATKTIGDRGALSTIQEIADAFAISRAHLMKVVHQLGRLGYVETVRGKGGGMRLARAPAAINVGEVLRATEDGFQLVDCMGEAESDCRIAPACALKGVLGEATAAFLRTLDRYTLADLLRPRITKILFAGMR